MQAPQTRYTGAFAMPRWGGWSAQAGHCRSCGEPSAACCCGCRECRREAKELLVTSQTQAGNANLPSAKGAASLGVTSSRDGAAPALGGAFVGGGCCVSLSVEYAPDTPTTTFGVEVIASDSDGTIMGWGRSEAAGAGYQVREGIITTKPGAKLAVAALNCTARVRWCEVFSC